MIFNFKFSTFYWICPLFILIAFIVLSFFYLAITLSPGKGGSLNVEVIGMLVGNLFWKTLKEYLDLISCA